MYLNPFKQLYQNTTDWEAYNQQKFFSQFWRLQVQDQGVIVVRWGPSSRLQTFLCIFTWCKEQGSCLWPLKDINLIHKSSNHLLIPSHQVLGFQCILWVHTHSDHSKWLYTFQVKNTHVHGKTDITTIYKKIHFIKYIIGLGNWCCPSVCSLIIIHNNLINQLCYTSIVD